MSRDLLIIFVKNLIPGQVKTRLAKDIGTDLAMEVYKELVLNTAQVANKVKTEKAVYYSDYVEKWDFFDDEKYKKHIQEGRDLGQCMLNAFYDAFEADYDKVVLVGTDIPDLSKKIVADAFEKLKDSDVVVGPADDGGYYLIGMKQPQASFFENKEYSHPRVFEELKEDIEQHQLKLSTLPVLIDLDTKEDMVKAGIEIVYEDEEEEDDENAFN